VEIEIASVSKPMCLLSGSVVVTKPVALNPTVAADVMDAGEKISDLLLLSVDFSCLVSSCRTDGIADAGEGMCVPLLSSALLFSFAAVCIAEAGENIGSLRFLSASLSAALFPFAAAVCISNAGEGICVPLSPTDLLFNRSVVVRSCRLHVGDW
jgi:hypothetical protein